MLLNVFVSAASAPELPKFGFEAAIASAEGDGERDWRCFPYLLLLDGTPAVCRAED